MVASESRRERFRRVLDEHGAALWRLTAAYGRTRADREDLHQDILVAIWTALKRFRGDCSERTFVYRIAHNRGLTFRFRGRRKAMDSVEDPSVIVDGRPGPDADLTTQQRREALHRAIRRLPMSRRQVVVLSLDGLLQREIASILGISENNVAVRLSRARADLQRQLEKET